MREFDILKKLKFILTKFIVWIKKIEFEKCNSNTP